MSRYSCFGETPDIRQELRADVRPYGSNVKTLIGVLYPFSLGWISSSLLNRTVDIMSQTADDVSVLPQVFR
jgi:hypothetical protein